MMELKITNAFETDGDKKLILNSNVQNGADSDKNKNTKADRGIEKGQNFRHGASQFSIRNVGNTKYKCSNDDEIKCQKTKCIG